MELNNRIVVGICLLTLLLGGYWIGGAVAVKILLYLVFASTLPIYLILRKVDLEEDERIFFSFFLGLGIYPVLVYYFTIPLTMLTTAGIAASLVLYGIGLYLHKNTLQEYMKGIE